LHLVFALLANTARRAIRCVRDYAGHALLPTTCPHCSARAAPAKLIL
jgi:hypothetical protein